MPPKKVTGAAATAKEHKTNKTASSTATAASHGSYKDMIKEAIITLKDRAGSSRQALKKYVRNNNNLNIPSEAQFDSLFNKALKSGVEKGDFTQPKGPSGPVKLAKKEAGDSKKLTGAAATAKKEKEAKETKAAPAKKTATKPKAEKEDAKKADKKTTTTTKKAPATKAKAKANSTAKRTKTTKAPASAPAVTEVPTVMKKTKSGRVTKTKSTTTGSTKKAPAKKAAPKKAAKAATPKKAEETKA